MDIDKLLEKKLDEVEMPKNINLKIENLLNEEHNSSNSINHKIYLKTVACLIIAIVLSVGLFTIINNKITFKNNGNDNQVIIDEFALKSNTYTYITDSMRKNASVIGNSSTTAQMENKYTSEYMLEKSNIVALVTIRTIEGANREYNMTTMTYGKMLVNNVILGDIKSGDEIGYLKPGGFITIADYDKYDNDEAVQKRDKLREEMGINIDKTKEYYHIQLTGDIEIEVGKTYLAYLHYDEKNKKYEMIGLGDGLREVNVEQKEVVTPKEYNLDELKILNNNTNEWESLIDYIENNI